MKKNQNTNKGITLIALVITIIVLLILAGVALATLTGDSGILSNAENAKEQTNLANSKEQVQLAVQGALTKTYAEGLRAISRDYLLNELNNVVGTGKYELSTGDAPWTVTVKATGYSTTVSSTGKITEVEDEGGNGGGDTSTLPTGEGTTPWLPSAKFSQVKGTDLSTGLVIANTADGTPGTQNYVWIEVPTTISASIDRDKDGTAEPVTLAEAESDDEILEILEVYAGKGTNTSYRSTTYKDVWYDSTGKTKGKEGANEEDVAGCGMTYTQYQTAYSKMLNSIKDNGGFWLAQYEAGIQPEATHDVNPTNRTSHTVIGEKPSPANYAKDQYPYNYVYCSEAQKIANADSVEGKYTSSLPFGIQWDLVCKFLEVKNEQTGLTYADIATQSTWGNYRDTTYIPSQTAKYSKDYGTSFDLVHVNDETDQYEKTASGGILLTTGAIEEATATVSGSSVTKDANPMNIYDFCGNVTEFTLESTADNNYPCAGRGGVYGRGSDDDPASGRGGFNTDTDNSLCDFRSVLY